MRTPKTWDKREDNDETNLDPLRSVDQNGADEDETRGGSAKVELPEKNYVGPTWTCDVRDSPPHEFIGSLQSAPGRQGPAGGAGAFAAGGLAARSA